VYAFEELFLRHQRQLYRLACLTTYSADDAADALQDAMLAAHRSAAGFRHDSAVISWLHRIVLNACLDRRRRDKGHQVLGLDDVGLDSVVVAVGDTSERTDTAVVVRDALRRLPVDQRVAVVVVDMLGYSVGDAARLIGIPEGTVKSRCARARRKLADLLGTIDQEPADTAWTSRGGSSQGGARAARPVPSAHTAARETTRGGQQRRRAGRASRLIPRALANPG